MKRNRYIVVFLVIFVLIAGLIGWYIFSYNQGIKDQYSQNPELTKIDELFAQKYPNSKYSIDILRPGLEDSQLRVIYYTKAQHTSEDFKVMGRFICSNLGESSKKYSELAIFFSVGYGTNTAAVMPCSDWLDDQKFDYNYHSRNRV